MRNFRLVILDYPKLHLNNQITKNILLDVIVAKQNSFERTDEFYVPNDKHDLIGTHFLIYDVTNPFKQKLIMGVRLTYEERAKLHKVSLPILDVSNFFDSKTLDAFLKYRLTHPELVDCNSLFVEKDYSYRNAGLKLIDIGYAMIYFHLKRAAKNHFVGGSNEKYKSSRWVESIGEFSKDFMFTHPVVKDPHMLIMIDKFKVGSIRNIYFENKDLFDNLIEFHPEQYQVFPLVKKYENYLVDNAKEPVLNRVG